MSSAPRTVCTDVVQNALKGFRMISPDPVKATQGSVAICYREQLMCSLTSRRFVNAST